MRFLDVMRPAAAVTVQVGEPKKRLSYREKSLWTSVVLLIFLVLGQIPLFGLDKVRWKKGPTC